jgi:rhombotarget A family protien
MSWPRESLLIALLVLSASWASADTITVDTASDIVADDGVCSLREAVEYFNRARPQGGHMGCKPSSRDPVNTVKLPVDKGPYIISNGAIRIHTNLEISADAEAIDQHAVIQVTGPRRAFIIFNNAKYDPPACFFSAAGCSPGNLPACDSAVGGCSPALGHAPACYFSAAGCAPGNAPTLDPLSDADDPDVDIDTDGDFVTYVANPKFSGLVRTRFLVSSTPISATETENIYANFNVIVTLYATPKGGKRETAGSVEVLYDGDAVESWSIVSSIRQPGQYEFVAQGKATPVSITEETVDSGGTVLTSVTTPEIGDFVIRDFTDATTLVIHEPPSVAFVSFRQIDIRGCGLDVNAVNTQGCASDNTDGTYHYSQPEKGLSYDITIPSTGGLGGIIYSSEKVRFANAILGGGTAVTGGALYFTETGGADLFDTLLRKNKANNGAAIFNAANSLTVERSLLTENEVTGAGAVIEVISPDMPEVGDFSQTKIQNTTVSGNQGVAISLHDDMQVNASTVVLNSDGGINFNGQQVSVYNSIVAGNHTTPADPALPVGPFQDCIGFAATSAMDNSLIIDNGGCPEPVPGSNRMQMIDNGAFVPEQQLMATNVGSGKCNSDFGLLCPLAKNGGLVSSHKPRVLSGTGSIDASPIVNKGSSLISAGTGSCPGTDQRNEERLALSCDIGAVELQQVGGAVASGDAISFGEVHVQSLGDDLADEELLRTAFCPAAPPAVPNTVVPGSYRPGMLGCPWIQKLPSKGRVEFLPDGRYVYTPDSDFHGFDRFEMRVMTTVSVMNADPKDQSRLIRAQVIVEPGSGMASSSVGGAADSIGLALLALLGLGTRARWRKQA